MLRLLRERDVATRVSFGHRVVHAVFDIHGLGPLQCIAYIKFVSRAMKAFFFISFVLFVVFGTVGVQAQDDTTFALPELRKQLLEMGERDQQSELGLPPLETYVEMLRKAYLGTSSEDGR